ELRLPLARGPDREVAVELAARYPWRLQAAARVSDLLGDRRDPLRQLELAVAIEIGVGIVKRREQGGREQAVPAALDREPLRRDLDPLEPACGGRLVAELPALRRREHQHAAAAMI